MGALVWIALLVAVAAGVWRMFVKAGHPGWAVIVPIFNLYTWIKLAGKPGWWFVLYCVPFLGVVLAIYVNICVARNFGRTWLYGIAITFLPFIFVPVLGFGSSMYSEEWQRSLPSRRLLGLLFQAAHRYALSINRVRLVALTGPPLLACAGD